MNNEQVWFLGYATVFQWLLGIALSRFIFPEEKLWSWGLVWKGLFAALALVLLVVGTMYLRGQFLHYFFSLSASS